LLFCEAVECLTVVAHEVPNCVASFVPERPAKKAEQMAAPVVSGGSCFLPQFPLISLPNVLIFGSDTEVEKEWVVERVFYATRILLNLIRSQQRCKGSKS
jgi:hypothetical protein